MPIAIRVALIVCMLSGAMVPAPLSAQDLLAPKSLFRDDSKPGKSQPPESGNDRLRGQTVSDADKAIIARIESLQAEKDVHREALMELLQQLTVGESHLNKKQAALALRFKRLGKIATHVVLIGAMKDEQGNFMFNPSQSLQLAIAPNPSLALQRVSKVLTYHQGEDGVFNASQAVRLATHRDFKGAFRLAREIVQYMPERQAVFSPSQAVQLAVSPRKAMAFTIAKEFLKLKDQATGELIFKTAQAAELATCKDPQAALSTAQEILRFKRRGKTVFNASQAVRLALTWEPSRSWRVAKKALAHGFLPSEAVALSAASDPDRALKKAGELIHHGDQPLRRHDAVRLAIAADPEQTYDRAMRLRGILRDGEPLFSDIATAVDIATSSDHELAMRIVEELKSDERFDARQIACIAMHSRPRQALKVAKEALLDGRFTPGQALRLGLAFKPELALSIAKKALGLYGMTEQVFSSEHACGLATAPKPLDAWNKARFLLQLRSINLERFLSPSRVVRWARTDLVAAACARLLKTRGRLPDIGKDSPKEWEDVMQFRVLLRKIRTEDMLDLIAMFSGKPRQWIYDTLIESRREQEALQLALLRRMKAGDVRQLRKEKPDQYKELMLKAGRLTLSLDDIVRLTASHLLYEWHRDMIPQPEKNGDKHEQEELASLYDYRLLDASGRYNPYKLWLKGLPDIPRFDSYVDVFFKYAQMERKREANPLEISKVLGALFRFQRQYLRAHGGAYPGKSRVAEHLKGKGYSPYEIEGAFAYLQPISLEDLLADGADGARWNMQEDDLLPGEQAGSIDDGRPLAGLLEAVEESTDLRSPREIAVQALAVLNGRGAPNAKAFLRKVAELFDAKESGVAAWASLQGLYRKIHPEQEALTWNEVERLFAFKAHAPRGLSEEQIQRWRDFLLSMQMQALQEKADGFILDTEPPGGAVWAVRMTKDGKQVQKRIGGIPHEILAVLRNRPIDEVWRTFWVQWDEAKYEALMMRLIRMGTWEPPSAVDIGALERIIDRPFRRRSLLAVPAGAVAGRVLERFPMARRLYQISFGETLVGQARKSADIDAPLDRADQLLFLGEICEWWGGGISPSENEIIPVEEGSDWMIEMELNTNKGDLPRWMDIRLSDLGRRLSSIEKIRELVQWGVQRDPEAVSVLQTVLRSNFYLANDSRRAVAEEFNKLALPENRVPLVSLDSSPKPLLRGSLVWLMRRRFYKEMRYAEMQLRWWGGLIPKNSYASSAFSGVEVELGELEPKIYTAYYGKLAESGPDGKKQVVWEEMRQLRRIITLGRAIGKGYTGTVSPQGRDIIAQMAREFERFAQSLLLNADTQSAEAIWDEDWAKLFEGKDIPTDQQKLLVAYARDYLLANKEVVHGDLKNIVRSLLDAGRWDIPIGPAGPWDWEDFAATQRDFVNKMPKDLMLLVFGSKARAPVFQGVLRDFLALPEGGGPIRLEGLRDFSMKRSWDAAQAIYRLDLFANGKRFVVYSKGESSTENARNEEFFAAMLDAAGMPHRRERHYDWRAAGEIKAIVLQDEFKGKRLENLLDAGAALLPAEYLAEQLGRSMALGDITGRANHSWRDYLINLGDEKSGKCDLLPLDNEHLFKDSSPVTSETEAAFLPKMPGFMTDTETRRDLLMRMAQGYLNQWRIVRESSSQWEKLIANTFGKDSRELEVFRRNLSDEPFLRVQSIAQRLFQTLSLDWDETSWGIHSRPTDRLLDKIYFALGAEPGQGNQKLFAEFRREADAVWRSCLQSLAGEHGWTDADALASAMLQNKPEIPAALKQTIMQKAQELFSSLSSEGYAEEQLKLWQQVGISTTGFFRDGHDWVPKTRERIRELIRLRTGDSNPHVHALSLGGSNGQEAYSVAMMMEDELRREARRKGLREKAAGEWIQSWNVVVKVVDINLPALWQAARGRYYWDKDLIVDDGDLPAEMREIISSLVSDLQGDEPSTKEYLSRYFSKEGHLVNANESERGWVKPEYGDLKHAGDRARALSGSWDIMLFNNASPYLDSRTQINLRRDMASAIHRLGSVLLVEEGKPAVITRDALDRTGVFGLSCLEHAALLQEAYAIADRRESARYYLKGLGLDTTIMDFVQGDLGRRDSPEEISPGIEREIAMSDIGRYFQHHVPITAWIVAADGIRRLMGLPAGRPYSLVSTLDMIGQPWIRLAADAYAGSGTESSL